MRLKAQREKMLKIEIEADRIKWLTETLKAWIIWILNEIPNTVKIQNNLALHDFLLHIQKPKGYTVDRQRGVYIDALLISTWLWIWHINGQSVTSVDKIAQSKITNDMALVVKNLLENSELS